MNELNGWIKLNRNILNWQWVSSEKHLYVFIHLLLRASFKETKFKKRNVSCGQLPLGMERFSEQLKIPKTTLYRTLKDLVQTGEIIMDSSRSGTMVTIVNWKKYQDSGTLSGTIMERKRNENGTKTELIKEGKELKKERNNRKRDSSESAQSAFSDAFNSDASLPDSKHVASQNDLELEKKLHYLKEEYKFLSTDLINWVSQVSLKGLMDLKAKYTDESLADELDSAFTWSTENKKKHKSLTFFLKNWMKRSGLLREDTEEQLLKDFENVFETAFERERKARALS